MGTLASELGPHAERVSGEPRVYVDANMPAGLVAFMRAQLHWDVLFVIEHPDLRRARDGEHYRLARQWGRTLITLDRDYLDDRKFPPAESGGVLVLAAPAENGYIALLKRIDREVFRGEDGRPEGRRLQDRPLQGRSLHGRKLHLHVDWVAGGTISA